MNKTKKQSQQIINTITITILVLALAEIVWWLKNFWV